MHKIAGDEKLFSWHLLWRYSQMPTRHQQKFFLMTNTWMYFQNAHKMAAGNHFIPCTPVSSPRCTRKGSKQKLCKMTFSWVYFLPLSYFHMIGTEITFYNMSCGVILRMPTVWQQRMNSHDDLHLGIISKMPTRQQQRITSWHTLLCFSQDAYGKATDKNMSWRHPCGCYL